MIKHCLFLSLLVSAPLLSQSETPIAEKSTKPAKPQGSPNQLAAGLHELFQTAAKTVEGAKDKPTATLALARLKEIEIKIDKDLLKLEKSRIATDAEAKEFIDSMIKDDWRGEIVLGKIKNKIYNPVIGQMLEKQIDQLIEKNERYLKVLMKIYQLEKRIKEGMAHAMDLPMVIPTEKMVMEAHLLIRIAKNGDISVAGKKLDLASLKKRLARVVLETSKTKTKPIVQLEAAAEAAQQVVIDVLNTLRESGISSVKFTDAPAP